VEANVQLTKNETETVGGNWHIQCTTYPKMKLKTLVETADTVVYAVDTAFLLLKHYKIAYSSRILWC